MSASIHPDPYIANAARQLTALNAELSEAERTFLPEARLRRPSAPLVAQIDAELTFAGAALPVTLNVYGRFTPARRGGHEPGERPYEPNDPAGFVPHSVMVGETDILGDIGQAGEDAIVRYVMENCEREDEDAPEPERCEWCEDRR